MDHIFNKLFIGIIVLGCLPPVLAQADDPYFPLLEDQTTHTNLPKDVNFDIFGFKLLMTPAEVDKRIAKIGNDGYTVVQYENLTRGLRDKNGNEVHFKYGRMQTNLEKSYKDYITMTYTSTLLGNRVSTVRRTLSFKDGEVSVSSLLESIFNKYGNKTSHQQDTDYQVIYRYFFVNGKLAQGNGKISGDIKTCWYTDNDFSSDRNTSYNFSQNRKHKTPICNGGIEVSIFYGARKDLSYRVEFKMWDRDLKFKNLQTQDVFLLEAMTKEMNSKTGTAAPKL